LAEGGEDIRTLQPAEDGCFLFTDHIPMQKKTLSLLSRLGVRQLSLGPRMLFASHCMVLVHNELDRRAR
jgi:tRNA (pseudouridine54-N1)-methyltransferase